MSNRKCSPCHLAALAGLCMVPAAVYGQNPGGVGGAGLWLKANSGITLSGATVTTWNDNSPNAYHMSNIAGTGGSGVQRQTGTSGINFNPAVLFTGTARHFLRNTSAGAGQVVAGSSDVFIVMRSTQYGTDGFGNTPAQAYSTPALLSTETYTTPADWSMSFVAGTMGIKGQSTSGLDNIDARTPAVNDNFPRILMGSRTRSAAGLIETAINDRTVNTSNTSDNSALDKAGSSQPGFAIANSTNTNVRNYMQYLGGISEVVVFPANLTAADRQKVWSYLGLKYGITLDQSSPYSYLSSDGTAMWDAATGGSYNKNITGIGRDDAAGLDQRESRSVNPRFQVTIGNANTIVPQNENHPTGLATDQSFMTWADNTGDTALTTSMPGFATTAYRMGRIWQVQETGTVGSVRIAVPAASVTGYPNFSLLVSNDPVFASGDQVVPMTLATINGVSMYTAVVDYTDGQFFTFGYSARPLPVRLMSFGATANGCSAALVWQTAGEQAFSHFEVEHGTDGRAFSTIGRVESKRTSAGSVYGFDDPGLTGGRHYFRLKLVDDNGSYSYSNTIILTSDCGGSTAVTVLPNPATDEVTVSGLTAGQTVRLVGANGALVLQAVATGAEQTLDIRSLAEGIYLVHVAGTGGAIATIRVEKR